MENLCRGSADHSSQPANWCFMKITGPYLWLYICPIWLGRFIWHLNYEFPVWRLRPSKSIDDGFKNSPGVWQESWVLWGLFVAPTLWTFHCTLFSPCARKHPVDFIILSSSPCTARLVSQFPNTYSAKEFLCKLQSSRNRVHKSFAHEGKTQWEKGLVCARDGSVQPVVTILHCSEDISQPEEQ